MSIDLAALDKAAAGDPTTKVTVSKRWLREVHRLLRQGEADKAALASSQTVHQARDRMDNIFAALHRKH